MIDILALREALNQLPFRDGQRRAFLGRISEAIVLAEPESDESDEERDPADEGQPEIDQPLVDPPEVIEYLNQLESALAKHDLRLWRDPEDPDALFAVQELRRQTTIDLSWLGEAYTWSARILAVAFIMIAPGVVGMWLDEHFGRSFLGITGLALGLVAGIAFLWIWTKKKH